MAAKTIVFDSKIRGKLLCGINKIADSIGSTLGPDGHNVLLYKKENLRDAKWSDTAKPGAGVISTNDGVTIASAVILEDPFENMGASFVIEACRKTNAAAGDGTTTAAILTQSMVNEGVRLVEAGYDPVRLQKGISKTVKLSLDELHKLARPVDSEEKLSQIAAVSCSDEATGALIGNALHRIGLEGVINVDDYGSTYETRAVVEEGIVFEKGYLSEYMATNKEKLIAELHDAYVLVTDCRLNNTNDIIDLLLEVSETGSPLLIIADDISRELIGLLVRNTAEGGIETVAVNPPMYGEGRDWRLDDLAVQTGASFISEKLGANLRNTHLKDLGQAEYIRVEKNRTVIMGAKGDPEAVDARIRELRALIANAEYEFNKSRYQERLAKFVSGVATIIPGGHTALEITEKKMRIEDAVNAARAAGMEGIVPGGGTAFINILPAVEEYISTLDGEDRAAARIVSKALTRPLWKIAENSGLAGDIVVDAVRNAERGKGFNAVTGKLDDMVGAGIIDPVRVVASALENAASVAATVLTTCAGMTEAVK